MKNKEKIVVGLIGNPNTGKTSLLNCLTGLSLHVGNWPGKTVEKKESTINFHNKCLHIVDLPGTYSVAPYSEEEKISRDFIVKQNPEVIVQTVDVNSLPRHLLMTLELLALGKNLVLAFNFNKEAKRKNIEVNLKGLRKVLQIPIVQIEANVGEGKTELLEQIINSSQKKAKIPPYIKNLLESRKEIDHQKAIAFIQKKIAPFYSDESRLYQSTKIDSLLLGKYTAFPLFFVIIFFLFSATFSLSGPLIALIDSFLSFLQELIISLALPELFTSFLTEGLIGGVGSILSFVPLIFILFFLIALLEDSGYLARMVVLVDKIFHKFGISGRTFIPMILGFGCNVPAIMATRTIKGKKERQIAIFSNSFISCGARLPVYLLFTGIFFPEKAILVVMVLYLFGVATAFLASFVLSKLTKPEEENRLIIELPPYRWPTFRNVHKQAWFQTAMFIKKAGTIIFATVIVVWLLASLPLGVEYGSETSLLAKLGKFISPIFRPLGFAHWSFAVALLFGLVAKEVIIGTLGTLYGVGESGLMTAIPQYLTYSGALSFLFFVLLYTPCLATIAVIKKETGSWKFTFLQIAATILTAWFVSFFVRNLAFC